MSDFELTKETVRKALRPRLPSITDSLPDFLKDPANFLKVQKKIYATIATTHSHGEILEYAKCKGCTLKMSERRRLLKSLGFKNPAQYRQWVRTHQKIREKYPLMDWRTRLPLNLK